MKKLIVLLLTAISLQLIADDCHPNANRTLPMYDSGYLEVPLDYNTPEGELINLYWERFPGESDELAPVIFLAGGPLAHFSYHGDSSPYFIKGLFTDRNYITFDYRGYNCSSIIQSFDEIHGREQFYNISVMARDVRSIKEHLSPDKKVVLFGGSFGYVLGARVVNEHPDILAGAMIGWGSMRGEMYYHSLTVIDNEIEKQLQASDEFRRNWDKIQQMIANKELIYIFGEGDAAEEITVTQEMFEVVTWLMVCQSAEQLLDYSKTIKLLLANDKSVVEYFKYQIQIYYGLYYAHQNDYIQQTPTMNSAVLNQYRCNSYATDLRTIVKETPLTLKHLSSNHLVNFWDEVCTKFDQLQKVDTDTYKQINRTDVPVLAWLGKLDGFNWKTSEEDLNALTSNAEVHVFDNWSHDFGVDAKSGIETLTKLVNDFLSRVDQ